MKRKEFFLVIIIAIVSGVIGGVASIWFLLDRNTTSPTKSVQVIRAEKFEVIDQYGKIKGTFSADRYGASLNLFDSAGRLRGQFIYHGIDFNQGHTNMNFYGNNENLKMQ